MERLAAMAEANFRSAESQVLWLIKTTTDYAIQREAQPTLAKQDSPEQLLAAQELLAELRTAYLLAGGPSSRALAGAIARKTGHKISHTTVNQAVTGKIVPSWQILERIVKVLGGDVDHFRELWAQSRLKAPPST